jgi:hypothetical protein
LLFNPGPAIEAASLIIKKTVPFWRSLIQEVQGSEAQDSTKKKLLIIGNRLAELISRRGDPATSLYFFG